MRLFLTEIQAVSVTTGDLEVFNGPKVYGITALDAQINLYNMGLPYCKVTAEETEAINMPTSQGIIKQKPKYN
jgi:hypothetical protein